MLVISVAHYQRSNAQVHVLNVKMAHHVIVVKYLKHVKIDVKEDAIQLRAGH